MYKAVLISIQPQWCEKIASGEKTLEIRKTKPKLQTPFKCYIYCTNAKTNGDFILCKSEEVSELFGYNKAVGINKGFAKKEDIKLKGKVIGEFVCVKVDEYAFDCCDHPEIGIDGDGGDNWYEIDDEDLIKTCLSEFELKSYGNRYPLYGWHISDLVIYDKPKQLSEFNINRAPQSWCYVQED